MSAGITIKQGSAKPWRELFRSREQQATDIFARLVARIADRLPQAESLASRLEALAQAICELPGISGAMVVVCEEGSPLAYRGANLSLRKDTPPFTVLDRIQAAVPEGRAWSSVPQDDIEAPGAASLLGHRIDDGGVSLGIILIGLLGDGNSAFLLDGLNKGLGHFRCVIREAMQLGRMRLIEKLQELESEELGRTKPVAPEAIANRLKGVFRADAVTILVREQNKLYLSATTDHDLGTRVFSYEPREGLTGYIFSTGKPLRLRNAHDPEEARLKSGGDYTREAPRHPEALSKTGEPVRCLAVPMLSGGEVRGVIRVLRKERAEPFSIAEHNALQHFANLLGLAYWAAWRIFVADHVIQAETEAICITRSEPTKEHFIPKLVHANSGAEKLFNLKREQILGRDATELYYPGEYKKIRKALERAVANGDQVCGPIKTKINRFNDPEGNSRAVEISFRLLTSPLVQPDTHYTIAVIRDTTDSQMQTEQHDRLMKLLAKKGLAYFRADRDGRTLESSPAESKLTGYPGDELIGKSRELLYADPSNRRQLLSEVDQSDGRLVYTTQHLMRKDGIPFWAEGVIHLLKDVDGQKAGYEGLYEDVTERLQLQGFLDVDTKTAFRDQEFYRKLKENMHFQLLFMSSVGHQLRSPLGGLVQQLLNFQEGVTDADKLPQRLKYVTGQAKVCALLVANLTYMDKILRGDSFELKRVGLAKLAIETKLNFEHLALDKNLAINVDDKSLDKHPQVWGHRELIRQVLVNIVDNAIKYSVPSSHIRICGRWDQRGHYLQITNRGLPIPRQHRNRIFERGFRTREAEALIPAGTGLGLWLVRKICLAHGATIHCTEILEDNEQRTAFQISFPLGEMRWSIDVGGAT